METKVPHLWEALAAGQSNVAQLVASQIETALDEAEEFGPEGAANYLDSIGKHLASYAVRLMIACNGGRDVKGPNRISRAPAYNRVN